MKTWSILSAVTVLLMSAACATNPKPRHTQVGTVDAARFSPLMEKATALEETWRGGSPAATVRDLAERTRLEAGSLRGTAQTEAERLFITAVEYGATAFSLGTLIQQAADDETARDNAREAERRYAVDALSWGDPEKSGLVFEHGSGYLRAARNFLAGKIGEGLGLEQTLSRKLDARRIAQGKVNGPTRQ